MEVTSAERNYYKAAGAEVEEANELLTTCRNGMKLLQTVPPEPYSCPHQPDRALTIGGNHIHFRMVSGAPNVHCNLKGRRPASITKFYKRSFLHPAFLATRHWRQMICR